MNTADVRKKFTSSREWERKEKQTFCDWLDTPYWKHETWLSFLFHTLFCRVLFSFFLFFIFSHFLPFYFSVILYYIRIIIKIYFSTLSLSFIIKKKRGENNDPTSRNFGLTLLTALLFSRLFSLLCELSI